MLVFIIAAILLYFPYLWCYLRKEDPLAYGLSWKFSQKSLKDAFFWIVLTLVPLTVVSMNWPEQSLPRYCPLERIFSLSLGGCVAAIIEETFFRGFIQTILRRRLPLPLAIIFTALIFACSHFFVKVHFLRFATFFPGLIMGYLKEKHNSIAPSALYHALGNIWSIWFFPSLL